MMHSHVYKLDEKSVRSLVLILVVMDDALARYHDITDVIFNTVLILVVMDDALARSATG